jgi:hypothetical protein
MLDAGALEHNTEFQKVNRKFIIHSQLKEFSFLLVTNNLRI